jgi:diguanylate cyclase (GGDEF)-like protein
MITPSHRSIIATEPHLLEALLDDTAELAAVFDASGRCRYLNHAGRRMLGVDLPGVAELVLDAIVAPDDAARLRDDVLAGVEEHGSWSGELTLVGRSGTEFPSRSTLRRHDDGSTTFAARNISNEKVITAQLYQRAFHDSLTGLPHRSLFLDRLHMALTRTPGRTEPVALLLANLDRFKEKNDRFGQDAGDRLLKAVAGRLPAVVLPDDTIARWGGDEFVVLREGAGELPELIATAERIIDMFEIPFIVDGQEIFLTAAVGIAVGRPGELTHDELFHHADAAAQRAKTRGGDCYQVFDDEMRTRALRRAEMEDDLRRATARQELVLHYQPEVLLSTNAVVAVEALVRWQHPKWGLVGPAEFVPVAEHSSLILDVGRWVLRNACAQAAAWRATLPRPLTVAVNISARQFDQDGFVDEVATALAETGARPEDLCLEITESILMDDVDATIRTLAALKRLGVGLAVDDFGTGYSSLSYLRRFPIDVLKVDQSFVAGLGRDPEDSAIVEAVIHMGRALHLTTVAEGVETAHHLVQLRELGCDVVQGYHFARPQTAESLNRLLARGDAWLDDRD